MFKLNQQARLWLAGLVMLISAGCGAIGGEPPTPTPEPSATPTRTPRPTITPLPSPTATSTDPAAPPTVVGATLALEETPYVHSDGFFELFPPVGWQVEEEGASVTISDPEHIGFIYIQVTNTGYELDNTAFENFVTAREANLFSGYPEYTEMERNMEAALKQASVRKLFLAEGFEQTVVSFYDQKGAVMYALDFWANAEMFEAYEPAYQKIIEGITVDSSVGATLPMYAWVFKFTGPNTLFSIQIPTAWKYEQTGDASTEVDTFFAPDEHALVQNVTFDEGREISRVEGGQIALRLLRNNYAADIVITDDQVQPDNSERLTWYSPGGDYSGISFLETRATTFLMFTVMYDNAYKEMYFPVLEYTVGTYDAP